jgi:ABC-2 type transport system ATP-binding protein
MAKKVVEVKELKKVYGELTAVDSISFDVYENEIFGMVGPNGAGKTTTIECVEGLRERDAGDISIFGLNPSKADTALKESIGIQLQETSLPERIRISEAMEMFSSLYPHPINWRKLIERLSLSDKVNSFFRELSGGQKQRLFIALALVNDPKLIFLDELSTGLDPQARHIMWDLVRDIRNEGKTIFLTTHYMEEAERLCDRVAIIDHGKIVALDTPENLVSSLGQEMRIQFVVEESFNVNGFKKLKEVTKTERIGDRIIVYGKGEEFVYKVIGSLFAKKIPFREVKIDQPNLEDVFIALTGSRIRD